MIDWRNEKHKYVRVTEFLGDSNVLVGLITLTAFQGGFCVVKKGVNFSFLALSLEATEDRSVCVRRRTGGHRGVSLTMLFIQEPRGE